MQKKVLYNDCAYVTEYDMGENTHRISDHGAVLYTVERYNNCGGSRETGG